jgi:DNA-binding transcriptional MerR regulator
MSQRSDQPGSPDDLMTSVDAGRILDVTPDMVRLLAREGRLTAAIQTIRGVRLFRRADVEKLADARAATRAERAARKRVR